MKLSIALAIACAAGCGTTATGSAVFPDSTTSVQLSMSGGLAPAAGAGSTCQPIDEHYTYVIATRALSWTICSSPTAGGVYTPAPGQTTLSETDATQLVDALRALEPAQTGCGGDLTETLAFATPDGTRQYGQAGCMPGASDVVDLVQSAAH